MWAPPHKRMDGGSTALPTWAVYQPQHPTPRVAAPKDTTTREKERGTDRKQTVLSASVCQELRLVVGTRWQFHLCPPPPALQTFPRGWVAATIFILK